MQAVVGGVVEKSTTGQSMAGAAPPEVGFEKMDCTEASAALAQMASWAGDYSGTIAW